MEFITKENYEEMNKEAAKIIIKQIQDKPNSVIGFATGSTPLGMYNELVKAYREDNLDFSQMITFNLDEYVGLSDSDEQSYNRFMWDNLFSKINVKKEKVNIPNGVCSDTEEFCKEYEKKIKESGGIDIQILGIGGNGHIAFNEPGSGFDSRTRMVKLTQETIKDNSRFFNDIEDVPVEAITMGLGTIMESKKIIMLANGKNKRDAIKKLLNGSENEEVPATVLKNHPDVTIIVDKEASG